jgi:hypothetical protein
MSSSCDQSKTHSTKGIVLRLKVGKLQLNEVYFLLMLRGMPHISYFPPMTVEIDILISWLQLKNQSLVVHN